MSWSMIIPQNLLVLGAVFLVLAVVLVFVDVPGKGVPWDKVGAWFAFFGGFGVGGAAGGWLGRMFTKASGAFLSNGQKFTAQAVGVGVVGAIVVGLMLWVYARSRGKGIAAKSKIRSLLVVVVLAIVGTIFTVVPEVYGWADDGVRAVHSAATRALS